MYIKNALIAAALSRAMFSTTSFAGSDHQAGHANMNHSEMSHADSSSKMFLEKRDIDGYTVSFHVMEAAEGMNHGGSHNLMIKVEKDNAAISELKANSKVVYPGGEDESKPLMKMGDWYMVGYDLKDTGKHQLMVLFKTSDGKKHFGGVHYSK